MGGSGKFRLGYPGVSKYQSPTGSGLAHEKTGQKSMLAVSEQKRGYEQERSPRRQWQKVPEGGAGNGDAEGQRNSTIGKALALHMVDLGSIPGTPVLRQDV